MDQTFTYDPPPGFPQTDQPGLSFPAQAAKIATGQNWVTVGPPTVTIPPYTSGAVVPLFPATSTPNVLITPPPPGAQLLGPLTQVNTVIVFTDDNLAPSPGTTFPGQPIAVGSGAPGANIPAGVFTGLARALTVIVWTQDGANHNISYFGRETTIFGNPQLQVATATANGLGVGFGQGTNAPSGGATPFSFTFHLWPEVLWNCDANYYYSWRLYF